MLTIIQSLTTFIQVNRSLKEERRHRSLMRDWNDTHLAIMKAEIASADGTQTVTVEKDGIVIVERVFPARRETFEGRITEMELKKFRSALSDCMPENALNEHPAIGPKDTNPTVFYKSGPRVNKLELCHDCDMAPPEYRKLYLAFNDLSAKVSGGLARI